MEEIERRASLRRGASRSQAHPYRQERSKKAGEREGNARENSTKQPRHRVVTGLEELGWREVGGSEIAIDSRPDREAISPLYCGADPRARSDDP